MLLFVVTLLFDATGQRNFAGALERINMKPNAGGAIGYWLMTCLLERWFSPVGGGMLMVSIMLFTLLMAIGLRTLFDGLGRLTGWWEARQAAQDEDEIGQDDGQTASERQDQAAVKAGRQGQARGKSRSAQRNGKKRRPNVPRNAGVKRRHVLKRRGSAKRRALNPRSRDALTAPPPSGC